MALMMVFSSDKEQKYRPQAMELGLDYYQTDNIYCFLRYAKEAKPDVVMMHFDADFNNSSEVMGQIKNNLCEQNVCPPIYLNKPEDFEGDEFFYDTNKGDVSAFLKKQ